MTARIAISLRVVTAGEHPERRDALSQEWSAFVAAVEPNAVLVPVLNRAEGLPQLVSELRLDALILSGGNDIGQAPERDAAEAELLRIFTSRRMPVLGVCRGLQFVNHFFGGTISRDLSAACGRSHAGVEHSVELAAPAFRCLSGGNSIRVNSFHNQGVLKSGLAGPLKPFAISEEGVVEGLVHEDLPIAAVQWHPERPGPSTTFDARLIRTLFGEGTFWKHGEGLS